MTNWWIAAALAVLCAGPAAAHASVDRSEHSFAQKLEDRSVHEGDLESELECLAVAIYFEARGEPEAGQYAVGDVIMNRAHGIAYPDTICGVVYQNAHRRNRCQFSFACDGISDEPADEATYREIELRALRLLTCGGTCGFLNERIASSTHYHADYVQPHWSRALTFLGRVGQHLFYIEI